MLLEQIVEVVTELRTYYVWDFSARILVHEQKRILYWWSHTFNHQKKNKSKVSTGSILKSKNRWPYKTIKPDAEGPPLSKAERSLLERRKQKNKNDLKS